jgi:hypothetical protein
MTLVQTITVGSGGAATIAFSGIPQTATDLYLVVSSRGTTNDDFINMTLNGSSSSFTGRSLGTNISSSFSGTNIIIGFTNGPFTAANTFSSASIYIPNYTGSANKCFSTSAVNEDTVSTNWMFLNAGLWSNTAAITSLSLTLTSTNTFAQNSTASLYTITKGSGGATIS